MGTKPASPLAVTLRARRRKHTFGSVCVWRGKYSPWDFLVQISMSFLCLNCLTALQHSNRPSPRSTTFQNLCKHPSARVRTQKKARMTGSLWLQRSQGAAEDSDGNPAWAL